MKNTEMDSMDLQASARPGDGAQRKSRVRRSDKLKHDVEEFAAELLAANPMVLLARAGRITPSMIGEYLNNVRYLVSYTPVALARARELAFASGDARLGEYYEHRIGEETGHDRWATSDLEQLRSQYDVTWQEKPIQSMRRLVDFQRATVENAPKSYLAYILMAEYLTVLVGPPWVALLEERCSIPSHMLSVITRHAELDKAHVAEGLAEIDGLIHNDGELALLRETLRTSLEHFDSFCREIVADVAIDCDTMLHAKAVDAGAAVAR